MTKTYTARRTQDQWKTLVEQWQQSGRKRSFHSVLPRLDVAR
jgi:hypothetical protein